MGVGDSLEAGYTLSGPIPPGTWDFVGDGYVFGSDIDVQFAVLWRPAGMQSGGTQLAAVQNHFVPDASHPLAVVQFAGTATGIAAAAQAGDLLVLQVTGLSGSAGTMYELNGDDPPGTQIPHVDLPH